MGLLRLLVKVSFSLQGLSASDFGLRAKSSPERLPCVVMGWVRWACKGACTRTKMNKRTKMSRHLVVLPTRRATRGREVRQT